MEPVDQTSSKQNESWDSRFQQLKRFHAQFKHFRVPYKTTQRGEKRTRDAFDMDEEVSKLGSWVKRQRTSYTSNTLSADRIQKLTSIGFNFKPGRPTKEEKTQTQLGLLDTLRNRPELNAAQVADLDNLYEEWRRRAESNSSVTSSNKKMPGLSQSGLAANPNKHDEKFNGNLHKLIEFKESRGHVRIPRNENEELTALAKWTDRMRDAYRARVKGEKTSALTDERYGKIINVERCIFTYMNPDD